MFAGLSLSRNNCQFLLLTQPPSPSSICPLPCRLSPSCNACSTSKPYPWLPGREQKADSEKRVYVLGRTRPPPSIEGWFSSHLPQTLLSRSSGASSPTPGPPGLAHSESGWLCIDQIGDVGQTPGLEQPPCFQCLFCLTKFSSVGKQPGRQAWTHSGRPSLHAALCTHLSPFLPLHPRSLATCRYS